MTTLLHSRVDKLLTGVSQKRVPEGYISEDVLTFVNVVQDSGLIGSYDNSYMRIEHDIVGGDTPYPRITTSVKSSDRYAITKHGLSATISEETFRNEEQPFDARKDTTDDLTIKIWLGKEVSLATTLGDTAVLTNNITLAGTDQFNDFTNSDPLSQFIVARAAIKAASGQIVESPNSGFAIVPWEVVNVLKYHPQIIDLVKYTSNTAKGLTFEDLRNALGVGRLLVPFADYNNSVEGQPDNMIPVWGKNIVFGFAPRTGTKRIKTLGFRVQQGSPRRVFVDKLQNPPNSEEIKVDDSYDQLLTDVGAAYLIKDAIA